MFILTLSFEETYNASIFVSNDITCTSTLSGRLYNNPTYFKAVITPKQIKSKALVQWTLFNVYR